MSYITVHIPCEKNKTNKEEEKIRNPTDDGVAVKEEETSKNTLHEGNMLCMNYLEIPEVLLIAINVFNGRYGNGNQRMENLKGLGYTNEDINLIQKWVNIISPLYDK